MSPGHRPLAASDSRHRKASAWRWKLLESRMEFILWGSQGRILQGALLKENGDHSKKGQEGPGKVQLGQDFRKRLLNKSEGRQEGTSQASIIDTALGSQVPRKRVLPVLGGGGWSAVPSRTPQKRKRRNESSGRPSS